LNRQHHAIGDLHQHVMLAHAHPVAFLFRFGQALGFPVLDGLVIAFVLVRGLVADVQFTVVGFGGGDAFCALGGGADAQRQARQGGE